MPNINKFNNIVSQMKKAAKEIDVQRETLAGEFQKLQQTNEENLKKINESQKKFTKASEKFDELENKISADSKIVTVAEARKAMNQAETGLPFMKARANYMQAVENEQQDQNMLKLVDTFILPVIDDLLDAHKNGAGIPVKEIEKGVEKILNALHSNGFITTVDKLNYLYKEDEKGQTAFIKDLKTSLNLKDEVQTIASPNLKSSRDKFLHFVSKMCTSLGQPQLVKHCRKHMSKEFQAQLKESEVSFKSLVLKTLTNLNNSKPEQSKLVKKLKEHVNKRFTNRSSELSR
jgi:hypothetical protein